LAVPNQRIQVAADSVHDRLDHRQRDRGGQRGIDGIAAGVQHREAGLRRERLRRRHHVVRQHRRTVRRIR
jgi:hypothetical protein